LNNDTCELNLNELDAVTGAGPIVEAIHYAQVAGMLAAIYSRPAVETEAGCSKFYSHGRYDQLHRYSGQHCKRNCG
jgi:hypothetical protein